MCRYAQHCTVGMTKNDMAAAWLAECDIVGLCYCFETLDSPISWIGLHFFEDLLGLRHDTHDTTGDTVLQDVKSVVQRTLCRANTCCDIDYGWRLCLP